MSPVFLPGLKLSRALYTDAVAPLLSEALPGLPHAAALLGPGSEVLGLDTGRSTDHGWGPRLQLLVAGPPDRVHRIRGSHAPVPPRKAAHHSE